MEVTPAKPSDILLYAVDSSITQMMTLSLDTNEVMGGSAMATLVSWVQSKLEKHNSNSHSIIIHSEPKGSRQSM